MAPRSRSFRLAALAWALVCSLLVAVATPALAGSAAHVTEGAVSSSGERTLAGDTRYSTAVVLAQRATDIGAGAGGVVVVSGESLVDALSAVPLAAARSSVVVLTQTNGLPDVVAEFVRTHGASGVTIVGGNAAVSDDVARDLGELAGLSMVDRVAGADRYETAVAVAQAAGTPGGWCGESSPAVLMVNGHSLVDGVLAAPVAYAMGLPVLFTRSDALPDVVRTYLTDAGVTRAVLIGSNTEISDDVAGELAGLGVAVNRINGATPAERSVALADVAAQCGAASGEFALLDATVPVDGVAAATLLATGVQRTASGQPRGLVPVLAVDRELPAEVTRHLARVGDATDEVTLYALGGTSRITPQLMHDAIEAAEGAHGFTTDSSSERSSGGDGAAPLGDGSNSDHRRSSSGSSNGGTSRGERSSSAGDTSSGVTATTSARKTAMTTSVGDNAPARRGGSATRTAASPLRASPVGIEVTPTTEPPATTQPPTTQPTTTRPPTTTEPTTTSTTTQPQGPDVDVPDSGPPDNSPPTTSTPTPPATTQPPSTTQPPAPQPPAQDVSEFVSVSAGRTHSCGLRPDGTVECWGYEWGGTVPDGTFTEITSGSWHSCGIRPDSSVLCWGDNPFGQLDAPAYEFTTTSAGRQNTCGIRTKGNLVCWGTAPRGTQPPKKGHFVAVDVGYQHTCAIRTDGNIHCWGNNDYGQLSAPAGSFTAVTTGNQHTCGLRTNGQIACWGHPRHGRTKAPTGTFTAITAGYDHTCAIATDASLTCWGRSQFDQLGAPTGTHTSVAAGAFHNCAVATDASLTCWGYNDFGQLGPYEASGSTTTTTEPPSSSTLPPGEDVPVELEDDPAVDEPAEDDPAAAIDTAG